MTIHCLGSINIDHVYQVPHFPAAGETLNDLSYSTGLGGKGANQAIAAGLAGGDVRFIGGVGVGSEWTIQRLGDARLDTTGIAQVEAATGHAVIYVDPNGENNIVIHGGANRKISSEQIEAALAKAGPGDWWLTQNETNSVRESTKRAKQLGLRTAHVAAPFDPAVATEMLPDLDLLAVNEGEAAALAEHLGTSPDKLPVASLLVTLGARGAMWRGPSGESVTVPAFEVTPVDTTGAGDTFLGYMLASLDEGLPVAEALRRAGAAAAICVTRQGAANAIPRRVEVDAFLEDHS